VSETEQLDGVGKGPGAGLRHEARVTVFDLDDTLYPELAFAQSGLAVVGEYLTRHYGVPDAANRLLAGLQRGERNTNFNTLLAELGGRAPGDLLQTLVARYREHRPELVLELESAEALRRARGLGAVALITDGPVATQRAKVAALGIESCFDLVVFSGELGLCKPHPGAFAPVSRRWPQARCCYVADNPEKDFLTPNRLGWTTIRVARADAMYQRNVPGPEFEPSHTVARLSQVFQHWP